MKSWIPILKRWAKKDGVAVVGQWLYAYPYKDTSWYRRLLRHMTLTEARKETKRRKAALRQYGIRNAERIVWEREMLQALVTKMITALVL